MNAICPSGSVQLSRCFHCVGCVHQAWVGSAALHVNIKITSVHYSALLQDHSLPLRTLKGARMKGYSNNCVNVRKIPIIGLRRILEISDESCCHHVLQTLMQTRIYIYKSNIREPWTDSDQNIYRSFVESMPR